MVSNDSLAKEIKLFLVRLIMFLVSVSLFGKLVNMIIHSRYTTLPDLAIDILVPVFVASILSMMVTNSNDKNGAGSAVFSFSLYMIFISGVALMYLFSCASDGLLKVASNDVLGFKLAFSLSALAAIGTAFFNGNKILILFLFCVSTAFCLWGGGYSDGSVYSIAVALAVILGAELYELEFKKRLVRLNN